MFKYACGANQAKGGKTKRNPRSGPPKCRVDNYGLARKQSLLNIIDHLYRQTYKIYKTEKTEWLVNDGELIGVQEKHKRDLGIVLDKFFEPCFYGVPEPQSPLPVVQGFEMQKVDISAPKISSFDIEQPRLQCDKRNRLISLLNSDQVQLIDSRELKQRLLKSTPQVLSFSNKVEKKIKFGTRTIIGSRKPTPLEVLRASNRPKRSLKPRQKYSSSLGAIIHKQDTEVLPLIEDGVRFYERSNYATKTKLDQPELEKKSGQKAGKEQPGNTSKMWKYALKVRRSEAFSKEKNDMGTNVVCPKPKLSKYALNLRLDKMNKKIPLGSPKKKSVEDKVRTTRLENKAKQGGAKPRVDPTELGIGNIGREHNEIGRKAKKANYLDFLYDSEVEDQENSAVYILRERKKIEMEIKINIVKKIYGNVEELQAEEGRHYLKDFLYDSEVEDQENPHIYNIRELREVGKEKEIHIEKKTSEKNEGLDAEEERHYIKEKEGITLKEGHSLKDFLYDSEVEDQDNPEECKEVGKEKKTSESDEGLQAEEERQDLLYDSDVEDQNNPEACKEVENEKKSSESDEGLQTEDEGHFLKDFLYDSEVDQENPEECKEVGNESKSSESDERLQAEEGMHYLEDFLYDSEIENLMEENPEEYAKQLQEISEKMKSVNMERNQKSRKEIEEVEAETEFNTPCGYENLLKVNPVSMLKDQPLQQFKPGKKTVAEELQAELPSCHSEVLRTAAAQGPKSSKPLFAEFKVDMKSFLKTYIDEAVHSRISSLRPNRNLHWVVVKELNKVQFAKIQPSPILGIRLEYDLSLWNSWTRFRSARPIKSLPYKRSSPFDTFLRIMIWFQVLLLVSFLLFSAVPNVLTVLQH